MLNNSSVNDIFCSALEKAINIALRYDPGTQSRLSQLHNTSLAINLNEPNLFFIFVVDGEKINVEPTLPTETDNTSSEHYDVTLTGSAIDMIKLLSEENYSLAQSGVKVSGRVGTLTDFQTIFSNIEIDWEAPFVETFGPVAGHLLSSGIRKSSNYCKSSATTFSKQLPEILTDELDVLPHEVEVTHFIESVNKTRSASNRLAARVAQLANTLNVTLK